METTVRVHTSFRLRTELMERLRACAKASNRSLNNFVGNELQEAMFYEPK